MQEEYKSAIRVNERGNPMKRSRKLVLWASGLALASVGLLSVVTTNQVGWETVPGPEIKGVSVESVAETSAEISVDTSGDVREIYARDQHGNVYLIDVDSGATIRMSDAAEKGE